MGALIKNEFIKLIKKSKTSITFIIFTIVILGMAFTNYSTDKDRKIHFYGVKGELNNTYTQIEHLNNEINYSKEQLKNNSDLDRYAKIELEKYIKHQTEQVEEFENYMDELTTLQAEGRAEEVLNERRIQELIKSGQSRIEDLKIEKNDALGSEEINMIDLQIKRIEKYIEQFEFLLINKETFVEAWEYDRYNTFSLASQMLGMGVLGVVIAIFMSDIVSGECSPATFKFLLIQPVKKGKILFSKFFVGTTTIVFMILAIELIIVSIVGLTSKVNSSNNPVTIGSAFIETNTENGILFLPLSPGVVITNSELFIKSIMFQVLFIITTCAFVFMISTLVKSTLTSMSISVISLVSVSLVGQFMSFLGAIAHLLFTTYGDCVGVYNGSIATAMSNTNINASFGVVVMIITTIVAYGIAHINFTKKNFAI